MFSCGFWASHVRPVGGSRLLGRSGTTRLQPDGNREGYWMLPGALSRTGRILGTGALLSRPVIFAGFFGRARKARPAGTQKLRRPGGSLFRRSGDAVGVRSALASSGTSTGTGRRVRGPGPRPGGDSACGLAPEEAAGPAPVRRRGTDRTCPHGRRPGRRRQRPPPGHGKPGNRPIRRIPAVEAQDAVAGPRLLLAVAAGPERIARIRSVQGSS